VIKYEDVKVSPLRDHRWEVLIPICYKDVTVHSGYKTNGADIPRILWSIIPPNETTILPAVIIHDYLCDKKEYDKADRYFKEILTLLGINPRKKIALYYGVRVWHRVIAPLYVGIIRIIQHGL